MSRFPAHCPSCGGLLEAVQLCCSGCGTSVQGQYRPCPVCRLDPESRRLFELFLDARGNLKEVQRSLGLSYPTVRQRIDAMFQRLGRSNGKARAEPLDVLRRVREGELTVDQAERLLRQ